MEAETDNVRRFMNEYATRFNAAINSDDIDVDATAGAFAVCFMEAGPSGVTCGSNNAQFRELIPKGYQFYKSIGVSSMEIVQMNITQLDTIHTMVNCEWKSGYKRPDLRKKGIMRFNVIYFLQKNGESFKIFAYITGDEQKCLREHGLI